MAPAEVPERCREHGLVVGPDGRCVLCRRAPERRPAAGTSFSLAFAVIVCALLALGVVVLYLAVGRSDDRTAKREVSRRIPGGSTGTRVLKARPAWFSRSQRVGDPRVRPIPVVVRVKPRPNASTKTSIDADQDEREALAARKRMNRMYEQAGLSNAISQVSITMYMTDW